MGGEDRAGCGPGLWGEEVVKGIRHTRKVTHRVRQRGRGRQRKPRPHGLRKITCVCVAGSGSDYGHINMDDCGLMLQRAPAVPNPVWHDHNPLPYHRNSL